MSILLLLGGVGAFLCGMKEMSVGIEQSAGAGVRRLFNKISSNRVAGYGVGIGTTAIIQSSSATSIMTIGLANAGIVNATQGSAIVLGAKVGTTVTAFILALSGVSKGGFSMGITFASMCFVGVMMNIISKKDSVKKFSIFLTGFGLIFLGLSAMNVAIDGSESALKDLLAKLFQSSVMQNPVLLVIIGTLFTCLIQSSSAASGVFITLLTTGVLASLDQSFFLMMGANIGTCIDGLIASIGASTNGKRIGLFHVLTSFFGAFVFTIVLIFIRDPIESLFTFLFPKSRWGLALATFNFTYNGVYTLLLLPLLPYVVRITEYLIKDKETPDEHVLKFLDERLLLTPTIATTQIKNEVVGMLQLAAENLDIAFNALVTNDISVSQTVRSNEKRINKLNQCIADFLIKFSSVSSTVTEEMLIGATHHVINDIERIGDHAQNFMDLANTINSTGEVFCEDSLAELNEMYAKVKLVIEAGLDAYKNEKRARLSEVSALENEIDAINREFANRHIKRLRETVSNVEMQYYYDIISELERISDHVVNIAFSIVNPLGIQSKPKEKTRQPKKAR